MKVGLVLSGGGALGAFQAGVVEAIAAKGIQPTVLSGTSAGALNVAALAAGITPETLSDMWRAMRSTDVYRHRRDLHRLLRPRNVFRGLLDVIGWTYLYDTAPLRRTIVDILGAERVDPRPGLAVVVTAVDLASGDVVRFCNVLPPPARVDPRYRKVELGVDHLMASAAIPLLFRSGTVGGRSFVDGALLANTPLAPALHYEPDAVIVVTTAEETRPAGGVPATLGEMVERLVDSALGGSLRSDLAHARTINELCRNDPDDPRKIIDLLLIEPVGLDLGRSLDFSPERAAERIAMGREAGARALAGWTPSRLDPG